MRDVSSWLWHGASARCDGPAVSTGGGGCDVLRRCGGCVVVGECIPWEASAAWISAGACGRRGLASVRGVERVGVGVHGWLAP